MYNKLLSVIHTKRRKDNRAAIDATVSWGEFLGTDTVMRVFRKQYIVHTIEMSSLFFFRNIKSRVCFIVGHRPRNPRDEKKFHFSRRYKMNNCHVCRFDSIFVSLCWYRHVTLAYIAYYNIFIFFYPIFR